MSDAELTIALKGVVKRFGDQYAVASLDLDIAKGSFFSILGPSGCGKTTTLRMIAGFEQPDEGHILLEGQPVEDVPPYRRNVNTVFQSYALFEHLSLFENIAFGLRRKKVAEARDHAPRGGDARARAPLRPRQGQAAAALGRPAPARRAGARARQPPRGAAARRAAGRARPAAAQDRCSSS